MTPPPIPNDTGTPINTTSGNEWLHLISKKDILLNAGNNHEVDVHVDQTTNVGNNQNINVGNDLTENITGNFTQTVQKNSKTNINGSAFQKVIGSHDFFVSGPVNVKWDGANVSFHGGYTSDTFIGLKHSSFVGAQVSANASYCLDVTKGWKRSVCGAKELNKTQEKEEDVTLTFKVTAGTQIQLKVGNSFLKIDSDTIELNANHVVINSKAGTFIKSSDGDINIKSPSGDIHLTPSGHVTVPGGKFANDDLTS